MRLHACAACLLTVLTLAACGGNGDEAVWDGPPDPAADGTVAVDGFDDYTADVEETWEGSAAMAATVFLRLDERTATTTTIEASSSGEGEGPQTVVVTLDGLLDDSVRAERWTLEFAPESDVYRLTEASWGQRCQPDRGHEEFSPDACV